jgi:hypothetical protein
MLTQEQIDTLGAIAITMTGKPSTEAVVEALVSILQQDVHMVNKSAMLLYAAMSPEMRRTVRGIAETSRDSGLAAAYEWAGWVHDHAAKTYVYPDKPGRRR